MRKSPSDTALIAQGRRIQKLLRRTEPCEHFSAFHIDFMIQMIGDSIEELQGKRPAALTLNRPRDLGSFHRSYDQILETPEGKAVYAYFKAMTERAERLGLPKRQLPRRS